MNKLATINKNDVFLGVKLAGLLVLGNVNYQF